jgi:hypothetical protein
MRRFLVAQAREECSTAVHMAESGQAESSLPLQRTLLREAGIERLDMHQGQASQPEGSEVGVDLEFERPAVAKERLRPEPQCGGVREPALEELMET